MAHSVWCELVCRTCAMTVAGQWTTGGVPRRALMAIVRRDGMFFEDEETFCSQSCLDAYRREMAEKEPTDG